MEPVFVKSNNATKTVSPPCTQGQRPKASKAGERQHDLHDQLPWDVNVAHIGGDEPGQLRLHCQMWRWGE